MKLLQAAATWVSQNAQHSRLAASADLNKCPGLIECGPVLHPVPKGLETDVGILSKITDRLFTQPPIILVMQSLHVREMLTLQHVGGLLSCWLIR